jgi:arylsulfatase A-like enzyme
MWEVATGNDPGQPTRIAERLDCPVMQSPDVPDDHFFAGRMTSQVTDCLQTYDDDKPLFLAVGYRRPHLPFVAPRRYFDLYRPSPSWLAQNSGPSQDAPVMAWFNSDGYVGSAKRVGLRMPLRPTRQQAVDWNGYELRSYQGVPNHGPIDQSLQLELLRAYAACVSYVDTQVGRLLDQWDRSGRADHSVVVLWSDHGWHLGEHSAWGKMTNFEVATRVPLIIAAPGVAPARTRAISELVDLFPTICDLAAVDAPPHLQGESLREVLKHPGDATTAVALSQYARFGQQYMGRAVRTDHYRYVAWIEAASGAVVHRELYDHRSDPSETRNLANLESHGDLCRELELRLRESFGLSR